MKVAKTTAVLTACLTAFAGASWAGPQAGSVSGQVAVMRDGKTAALTSASSLQAGDRLVAMNDGHARVRFADGCVVEIRANTVTTVGAQSPCAAADLVKTGNPMQAEDPQGWDVGFAIFGFAAAFAIVTEMNKSDGDAIVAPPLSP